MSKRIEGETPRDQRLYNSLEAIIEFQEAVGKGVDRRIKENPEIVQEIKERRSKSKTSPNS